MTKYTPEKVAELIADNRKWVQLHRENKYQREAAMRMGRALDALTAVSAERDEWEKAYGEAVDREIANWTGTPQHPESTRDRHVAHINDQDALIRRRYRKLKTLKTRACIAGSFVLYWCYRQRREQTS